MANTPSITWFDYLPTELIFYIFNYLSKNEIIYTFLFLSPRLHQILLDNCNYLDYFETPSTNLNQWKKLLPVTRPYIKTLNINQTNSAFPLRYFPNLKSLIVSSPCGLSNQLFRLIIESTQFNQLRSLKIKENNKSVDLCKNTPSTNQENLWKKILNNQNSLEILESFLSMSIFPIINQFHLQMNFNLHSLTIKLDNYHLIFSLIKFTPNLDYLSIQSPPPREFQQGTSSTEIKLKKLFIKLIDDLQNFSLAFAQIYLNRLIRDIELFSSSLICLSLDLIGLDLQDTNEFPFNNIIFEQLMQSMVQLKEFHFYAKVPQRCDENILSRFENSFWLDRQWIFGMHERYIYTLPFRFDDLYEFSHDFDHIRLTDDQILKKNPRSWYHVKSIELYPIEKYKVNFIEQLEIKMPKLNLIKFGPCYLEKFNEREDVNRNERREFLGRLYSVRTIECTWGYIANKKEWLSDQLPESRILFLSVRESPSTENQISSKLNDKSQQLDTMMDLQLKQLIEIDYIYFPNVQHLSFYLYYYWDRFQCYGDLIIKIFENFQMLNTLTIYTPWIFQGHTDQFSQIDLTKLFQYLRGSRCMTNYEMRYFRRYILFSKKTVETPI